MRKTVALLGATGFVGSAVRAALVPEHAVIVVPSPRLRTSAREIADLVAEAATHAPEVERIRQTIAAADVLVNAAGFPDASSLDEDLLFGANALLPGVALEAVRRAKVPRFVHLSSAVVQNDKPVLDDSEDLRPFSPYSRSKVAGEELLRTAPSQGVQLVRFRPPSVHAPGRRVTRMVARIASSPVATVAAPGDQPTPQALLPNVAAAVAFLATTEKVPPPVVIHPWEGVTAAGLMRDLGSREPKRIPRPLTRAVVSSLKTVGRVHRPTAANARRVELLWMGQQQSRSWLTDVGWSPPVGAEAWRSLTMSDTRMRP